MAIIDVPPIYFPAYQHMPNLMTDNFQNQDLNGPSGTGRPRVAMVFVAPADGQIDGIEFYVRNASSPAAVKFSLQNVDSSGLPDGTVDQYEVKASGITASAWVSTTLTSDGTSGGTRRTVAKGDLIAFVAEWDSTQSGSYSYWSNYDDGQNTFQGFGGYYLAHNGTSWSKMSNFDGSSKYPVFAIRYVGGTYPKMRQPFFPITNYLRTAFNSGSTPDERALRLQVPYGARATGAWVMLNGPSNPFDLVLYDNAGTVLASVSFTTAYVGQNGRKLYWFEFATPPTLTAATTYRLAMKPTSTSNVEQYAWTFQGAAYVEQTLGSLECYLSTRTDGGAWTDTPATVPCLGLILDGVDTSGGGGGGGGGSFAFVG